MFSIYFTMSDFKSIITNASVLWGDMDDFGHVNNIVYLKWFETARVEIAKKALGLEGLQMDEIKKKDGFGPILANFNSNYRIPLRYPDTINIKTRVSHVGNSSFGIEHQMYSKENDEKVVFDAESVVVMVNYKGGSKFQFDGNAKKQLKEFM